MITMWHYLAIAAVIFVLGLVGFLTRRNMITMFLSAELMLQGVVLNLLTFSRFHANMSGQVFALFIVTVAACEAGLAMALFIALYRRARTLDGSDWQSLRESGLSAMEEVEALPEPVESTDPKLTPAGAIPAEKVQEAARV